MAQTDEAFAELPEGTIDALLEDPETLSDILLYHVVPGVLFSSDLTDDMEAETAQGGTVTFGVEESGVTVNDASVVVADIEASNGIIHVIDQVILPPAAEDESSQEEMHGGEGEEETTQEGENGEGKSDDEMMEESQDIVETAIANGSFELLVAAMAATNLEETFKDEGPFTVFAPTDDAFAALPDGTLESLLENPAALGDIFSIIS